MLRRVAIACLPVFAAAAVLAVVIGSKSGRPRPTPVAAQVGTHGDVSRVAGRRRHSPLPMPPDDVRGAAARRMAIPILMYHVVADPPPGTPLIGLWVRPETFAAEM